MVTLAECWPSITSTVLACWPVAEEDFQLPLACEGWPRAKYSRCYCRPCERGQVYIGQTGQCMETRVKEHHWHIQLMQPDNGLWQNTDSTMTISLTSRAPTSSPRNLATWTHLLGRLLSWRSTLTLGIGRMASL